MKALLLDGFSEVAPKDVLATLTGFLGAAGYKTEAVALREQTIAPCLGCFGCWVKTPGECVIDDDGRVVARAFARAHLVVYFTPVTFGGVSSELKKALDRLIPNISPFFRRFRGETHHLKRYARAPSLIGLGVLPHADPEAEEIFTSLVTDNATNFRSPRVATAVVSLDQPSETPTIVTRLVEAVTP